MQPQATADSIWRTSTQQLARRRAPLAKPGLQIRNTHQMTAIPKSQMESVVTSHGDMVMVMVMVSFCSFFVRDFVLVHCFSRALRATSSRPRPTPHAYTIVCTIYRPFPCAAPPQML